jgi:hypothetical protein
MKEAATPAALISFPCSLKRRVKRCVVTSQTCMLADMGMKENFGLGGATSAFMIVQLETIRGCSLIKPIFSIFMHVRKLDAT